MVMGDLEQKGQASTTQYETVGIALPLQCRGSTTPPPFFFWCAVFQVYVSGRACAFFTHSHTHKSEDRGRDGDILISAIDLYWSSGIHMHTGSGYLTALKGVATTISGRHGWNNRMESGRTTPRMLKEENGGDCIIGKEEMTTANKNAQGGGLLLLSTTHLFSPNSSALRRDSIHPTHEV